MRSRLPTVSALGAVTGAAPKLDALHGDRQGARDELERDVEGAARRCDRAGRGGARVQTAGGDDRVGDRAAGVAHPRFVAQVIELGGGADQRRHRALGVIALERAQRLGDRAHVARGRGAVARRVSCEHRTRVGRLPASGMNCS